MLNRIRQYERDIKGLTPADRLKLIAIIKEFRDYENPVKNIVIPKGSRICCNCNGTGVLVEKKVYHHLCPDCLGTKRINRTTHCTCGGDPDCKNCAGTDWIILERTIS